MILALLLVSLVNVESAATQQNASPQTAFKCGQSAAEQNPLLREAIANQYTVRRVEFVGNETTRDYFLRRRVFLREGDLFTRKNLMRSLLAVNKLGIMYPVKLNDVIVQLDKPYNHIDVTFCFRERHRPKRASYQIAGPERG